MKYIITIIAVVLSFSVMGQIAPYQIINDEDGQNRILMTNSNGEYIRVGLLDAVIDSIGIQLEQVGDSICIVGGNCVYSPTGGNQLTEAEVDAYVANNGYLEVEVDGSITNEIQDISLSGSDLSISSGSTIDLSSIDTDTNTQLTESQVDAYADNNGYLETEVDGSITNELQTISEVGSTVTLSNGGGSFIDSNTQLTESQVDAYADNNGYLEVEVDGSITNELQTITDSGATFTLSNGGGTVIKTVDTNTQLTESQVDAYADNNGYLETEVDGSITNELQTISKAGTTVTLSNSGGSFTDAVDDADNDPTNEIQDTTEIVGLLEFVQNNSTGGSGGKFVDGTDTDEAVYTIGNVGIGTTNPDKLLVVSGDDAQIVINDTDATDNPRIRFRESGATSGGIYTDAGELIFDSGTTEKMRIDTDGNVGINETNPQQTLTVNGDLAVTDRVGTAAKSAFFDTNGKLVEGDIVTGGKFVDGVDAGDAVYTGGSVGMGTDDPVTDVHISDDQVRLRLGSTKDGTWIAGTYMSEIQFHSGDTSGSSGESIRANIRTEAANSDGSDVQMVFQIKGDVAGNPTDAIIIKSNKDLDVKGGINVDGNASSNGNLYIDGTSTFNDEATFYENCDFQGTIDVGGIGTSTIEVSDRTGGAAVKSAFFDANNQLIEGDLVVGGGKFVNGTDTNDAVYNSGNVGIGTNSPDALLHVKSTGNGEIEVERNAGAKINIQAQSARGVIGTDSSHELDFKTNATTRVRILTNGNVGINDTSPSNTLSVGGDLGINGTYYQEFPKDSGLKNVVMGTSNASALTSGSNSFITGTNNVRTATSIDYSNVAGTQNVYDATAISYIFANGGYNNQNNLTTCRYSFFNGYLNARASQGMTYSFFNGRENALASSGSSYSFYNGYRNLYSSTTLTAHNFYQGSQNAFNATDSDYSFLAGYRNVYNGAADLDYSFIFGRENAYNAASTVSSTNIMGYRNAYTTTGSLNYFTSIGFENAKLPTVALNNTILLGYRQGYSAFSKGAAAYRLAIGMYQDDPLIYGEFDNKIVEIDAHLTVEDGIQIEVGDEDEGRILYSSDNSGDAIWGQADNVGRITTTLSLWSDERQVLLAGTAYASFSAFTFPPSNWTASQQHDGDILTFINRSGSTRQLTGDIEGTTSSTVDVLDDDTIRLVYYAGGDYWIVLSNN